MNKPALFCATLALAAVPALNAQTASATPAPMPSGPLLRLRAPDLARWIVTFNPGGGGKAGFSRKVAVTKTGQIRHEQTLEANGQRREKWCVGDLDYSKPAGSKRYLAYTGRSFTGGVIDERLYTDYSKTDFPGMEWVSAKNYATVRPVMNRDCIVFERKAAGGEAAATACVDLQTRLPVVLREGNETRVYEFQAAPQAALSLPAEIRADLELRARVKAKTGR